MQGERGGIPADTRRTRRWRVAATAVAATAALLAAGCQGSAAPTTQVAAGAVEKQVPLTQIDLEPASGTTGLRPDSTVRVAASHGKLTEVSVTDAANREIPGALSADGTSWASTGRLAFATSYRVLAEAVDTKGLKRTRTGFFSTLRPRAQLVTSISPIGGATVGVGMPIIVRFNRPVQNRAAVERGLVVESSKTADGSWSWISDEEVHYRPQEFWPAYTDVTLNVRLRGVDAGNGVWGTKSRVVKFEIGPSMVTVINVKKHHATIYRNGKAARTVPVSTGKAGYLTRGGTKVVLEKHVLKVMDARTIGIHPGDPEYYRLDVPYAMRVTWSGEFVHAAPWSVASQGRDNVSHGCVGMSTRNAIWLFNRTNIGDVVRVVGSPRKLEPGNGYTDWNVPWSTWVAGSAV